MNEQIVEAIQEAIQNAAASKAALVLAVGTATAPTWIDFGGYLNAGIVALGAVVSLSIIAVNLQSWRTSMILMPLKRKQERIRTRLLEEQAKKVGLNPNDL